MRNFSRAKDADQAGGRPDSNKAAKPKRSGQADQVAKSGKRPTLTSLYEKRKGEKLPPSKQRKTSPRSRHKTAEPLHKGLCNRTKATRHAEKPKGTDWLDTDAWKLLDQDGYKSGTWCLIWYTGVARLRGLNAQDVRLLSFLWYVYLANTYTFLGVDRNGCQCVRITATQLAREIHVDRSYLLRKPSKKRGEKRRRPSSGLRKLKDLRYINFFKDDGFLCIVPLQPGPDKLGKKLRVPDIVAALCDWKPGPSLALNQVIYWMGRRKAMSDEEKDAEDNQQDSAEIEGVEPPERRKYREGELRSTKIVQGQRVCFLSRSQLGKQIGRESEECRNWLDSIAGVARERPGKKDQRWKGGNAVSSLVPRLREGDCAYYAPNPGAILSKFAQVEEAYRDHCAARKRIKKHQLPSSQFKEDWPGMEQLFEWRESHGQQPGRVIKPTQREAEISRVHRSSSSGEGE